MAIQLAVRRVLAPPEMLGGELKLLPVSNGCSTRKKEESMQPLDGVCGKSPRVHVWLIEVEPSVGQKEWKIILSCAIVHCFCFPEVSSQLHA